MIESTFASSVGKYVEDFETMIEGFSGSSKAVDTVDGTTALHADLYI
ncbi:MAG: DegT/DnrJ/EryC1/StrS family aminotransferase [Colwellia sp.]